MVKFVLSTSLDLCFRSIIAIIKPIKLGNIHETTKMNNEKLITFSAGMLKSENRPSNVASRVPKP